MGMVWVPLMGPGLPIWAIYCKSLTWMFQPFWGPDSRILSTTLFWGLLTGKKPGHYKLSRVPCPFLETSLMWKVIGIPHLCSLWICTGIPEPLFMTWRARWHVGWWDDAPWGSLKPVTSPSHTTTLAESWTSASCSVTKHRLCLFWKNTWSIIGN